MGEQWRGRGMHMQELNFFHMQILISSTCFRSTLWCGAPSAEAACLIVGLCRQCSVAKWREMLVEWLMGSEEKRREDCCVFKEVKKVKKWKYQWLQLCLSLRVADWKVHVSLLSMPRQLIFSSAIQCWLLFALGYWLCFAEYFHKALWGMAWTKWTQQVACFISGNNFTASAFLCLFQEFLIFFLLSAFVTVVCVAHSRALNRLLFNLRSTYLHTFDCTTFCGNFLSVLFFFSPKRFTLFCLKDWLGSFLFALFFVLAIGCRLLCAQL